MTRFIYHNFNLKPSFPGPNMEKKNLTSRLKLLNDGRNYYLEFLRNLTPQVMLFTIALLGMHKLDINRIDFGNFWATAITFFFLGSFILAFYANSTLFYENCFSDLRKWRSDLNKQLTEKNITGYKRLVAKLQAAWNERFIEYLEAFTVLFFFQFAFAAIIVMSVNAAYGIWKATHSG